MSAADDQYDLYGGLPPHVKGSDTSLAAAKSQLPGAANMRNRVLVYIRAARGMGMTCDECEEQMAGRHQSISARVRELVLLKKIRDSGHRRKTRSGRQARIYVAVYDDPAPVDERDAQSQAPDAEPPGWGGDKVVPPRRMD